MLATCEDGARDPRPRPPPLAWNSGGQRRSEVMGLQIGDVRRLNADTWFSALGVCSGRLGSTAFNVEPSRTSLAFALES